jgi:hypothetical protein
MTKKILAFISTVSSFHKKDPDSSILLLVGSACIAVLGYLVIKLTFDPMVVGSDRYQSYGSLLSPIATLVFTLLLATHLPKK